MQDNLTHKRRTVKRKTGRGINPIFAWKKTETPTQKKVEKFLLEYML